MPAWVLILTLDQAVTQYGLQLLASLIIVTGKLSKDLRDTS